MEIANQISPHPIALPSAVRVAGSMASLLCVRSRKRADTSAIAVASVVLAAYQKRPPTIGCPDARRVRIAPTSQPKPSRRDTVATVAPPLTSPRTLRTTNAAESADQPAAAVAFTPSQKCFQGLPLVCV